MKKQRKKKLKEPPLSQRDKFLYALLTLVIVLLTGGFLCAYILIADFIAFSDKNVIAADNSLSTFFIFPFLFIFSLTGIIITETGYSNRVPLLGYGKSKQSKVQNKQVTASLLKTGGIKQYLSTKNKKQYAKRITCFVVALCSVSIVFSGFGICCRTVLTEDDQIVSYNSFNRITDCKNLQDADTITLSVQRTSRSNPRPHGSPVIHILNNLTQNWYYHIQMQITYGDTEFTVTPADFDDMTTEQVLQQMLHIKSFFTASQCEIRNLDYLDELQELKVYNTQETELLLQLFEQ